MAKFITRLFSRGSSFRGSQSSLNETSNRSKTASSIRSGGSLENLASYPVSSKELEKNKLHKASWEGSMQKIERLAQPGQINVKDPKGRTPLHLAVVKGHLGIVKRLIEKQARLDVVDADERTPLIKAVLSGTHNPGINLQICRALLQGGADDSINNLDRDGKSALHYAITYGNENLVELLLSSDKCDPNLTDRDQSTPLHLATKRNIPRMVELLLSDQHEQQADPNIINRYGQTPLHIAASMGYVDIVRLLLTANLAEPCDPRLTDSHQNTALQVARGNHQEACAKLIEEYQQHRFKPDLQRQTTISIHEPTSARINSSISMTPAPNLEHDNDDTSEDSTSMPSHKPLKSFPRRGKRESDQWSDDNSPSVDHSKSDAQRMEALFKRNLASQEQTKKTNPPATAQLLINNPLHAKPKRTPVPVQHTSSGPFYGIGPVIERVDSDNTSTSMSVKKLIQPTLPTKPTTVPHPVSTVKSWSDDTTSAPAPVKAKVEPRSNSWDTSVSDDDDPTISKTKEAPKTLLKPLAISTSIINVSSSDTDDDNSVDTEIRRLDVDTPSPSKGIANLVNKPIGSGYKVVGLTEVQSPVSEDSSWSTSLVPFNQTAQTKPVHPVVPAEDSTWDDDSRPLTDNRSSKGVDNLMKIMDGIVQSQPKPPPMNTTISKLVVPSIADQTESIASELTPRHPVNERKKSDEWSMSTTTEKKLKTPQLLTRDSHSSFAEAQLKELKESIRRLEENQDDTRDLKRQLHELELQKHNLEKSSHANDLILRDIKTQLEHEKSEKYRLESTTKNLHDELRTIRERLQESEDRKHQLNQRCLQLEHERDQQDNHLRSLETTRLQSNDEDLEKVQNRYREDLKVLFAENEQLHRQNKELQSDLGLHKDTIDVTVRYKLDLQKAIDEKTFFQREFDRLKQEKDLIEQERLEYKSKYDGLQDEIRMILSDRSKLEQKLTEELQEHFREKQNSTDHSNQYRLEIEHLNNKLVDAEARLHTFEKTPRNHPLSASLTIPSNIVQEENLDLNQTYPRENYLIQNTRLIRSNTQRAKSELEQLREEFDRLVSNYEPNSNAEQQQTELRMKIETFRQFYEQEFRQRQLINPPSSSTARLFPSTMETNLTERRSPTVSQLPRQASALLNLNKSGIS